VNVSAGLKIAAAYFWDFESRIRNEATGDIERSVDKAKGDFEATVMRVQQIEKKKHGGEIGRGAKRRFMSIALALKTYCAYTSVQEAPLTPKYFRDSLRSSQASEGFITL
jgi:hypothetical protein